MRLTLEGVRDPDASRKTVESFIDETLTKGKVFYEKCDTGDMSSVKEFARNVQQKFSAIHILVNNGEINSLDNTLLILILYRVSWNFVRTVS